MDYSKIAPQESIERAAAALKNHGMAVEVVGSGKEARERVLAMLPEGVEVMDMTSETLRTTGLAEAINKSGRFDPVHDKLRRMDRTREGSQMQKLGAAPDWAVGSVHALTEDGRLVIASNTGSQLPAYAYGASHLIWVVGAQKVVRDLDAAFDRIYNYTLPLESERAKAAYGVPGSAVNKMLIVNNEIASGRITVIIVKEALGF